MSKNGKEPATFVEFGWSLHENCYPSDACKVKSKTIEQTQNPDFNESLLFYAPEGSIEKSGFFWVQVKDKNQDDESSVIGEFKIKIDGLITFQPLHLDVILNKNSSDSNCRLLMSLCLE